MAVVYAAQDTLLDRTVAIKVLSNQQSADTLERFQREAKLIAKLTHYAILPIYDYGTVDNQPYIVMPHMVGGTLADKQHDRQPMTNALSIIEALASALDYAHQQNVIHRDIKPSNVLLDESDRPTLADFGIAQLTNMTQTQSVLGTPQFMAPEQWQGEIPTAATDQYQFAAMSYQLLTGQLPFSADNPAGYMFKHINEAVPMAVGQNKAVQLALQRGMAKEPSHRFDTVTQFVDALRTAVAAPKTVLIDEPTKIIPVTSSNDEKAQPDQKPHMLRLFVALIGFLVGFGGWIAWDHFNENGNEVTPVIREVQTTVGIHKMVVIPAGALTMGSTAEQIERGIELCDEARGSGACSAACCEDEAPVRLIEMDEYTIDQLPVTNLNYAKCIDAGDCTEPQDIVPFENKERPQHPVVAVTWNQAVEYCEAQGLRLPTEAEWEKAARGNQASIFPWGDEFEPARLNFCDARCSLPYADLFDDGFAQTAPVGRFPGSTSSLGVGDMAGNTWEWTADWYAAYDPNDTLNPIGAADGTTKVVRGGSFESAMNGVRTTDRFEQNPDVADNGIGFRCAADT